MVSARDRRELEYSMEFSISKNLIVDVVGDSSNSINRLSANWPSVFKENDQWALFTDVNYVKRIDHGVSHLSRLSLHSTIAAIQGLIT